MDWGAMRNAAGNPDQVALPGCRPREAQPAPCQASAGPALSAGSLTCMELSISGG